MLQLTYQSSTLAPNDPVRLLECKGQFISVCFESNPKPAAAHKAHTLTKRTTGVFRAGINFANLASVKEGIANGERGEVQPLAWGAWEHFPYTITHKGTRYIRLYPVPTASMEVSYFLNNIEVSKETFNKFLTPSDAAPKDAPPCITIKAENVIRIGKEGA